MPTYEYRCPDGHDSERFFPKISQATSTLDCPVCGKVAERRISAGGGLVFKGSGFYITDYGKDGKKAQREDAARKEGVKADAAKGGTGKGEGTTGPGPAEGAKPGATADKPAPQKGDAQGTPAPKGPTKSGGSE